MRKSITVALDEKTIDIVKLPLGKYAELLKALKELPKRIPALAGKSNDSILTELPNIIGEALPDFISIIAIATPLKKEEIETLGLDEVTRVVLAFVEVNNYQEVYDSIKKAIAHPATPKQKMVM